MENSMTDAQNTEESTLTKVGRKVEGIRNIVFLQSDLLTN